MDKVGIGLDYDGTIADTGAVKSAWIKEHLGLEVPPWKTDRTLCVPIIGLEEYARMGSVVYGPEATRWAQEVPGASAAIAALAARYRLYVITARNAEQMAWSRQWLDAHGLAAHIQGYLSSGERASDGSRPSKARLGSEHNIRILVDDDERHLDGPEVAAFQRILLKAGCDQPFSPAPGIALARSWHEALDLLMGKGDL